MMNLLKDRSKNIQFEAFHVFKVRRKLRRALSASRRADSNCVICASQVFVANPKKPPQIEAILRRNKDKLIVFLRNFHTDRDDEQFNVRATTNPRSLLRQ